MKNREITQQQKEIATIKERTIEVELSDADMQRLWVKTGMVGMTPGELLSAFIGDLVEGTYSNGSDERMYVEQWFDRCQFSHEAEKTFLSYLLQLSELDDFLNDIDTLEYSKAEKNSLDADITELEDDNHIWDEDNTKAAALNEIKEEIERVEEEILFQQEIINKTWNEFLNWTDKKDFNQETEIKAIQAWKKGMTTPRKCRVCGCTQNHACPGGCHWAAEDLCSRCAGAADGGRQNGN